MKDFLEQLKEEAWAWIDPVNASDRVKVTAQIQKGQKGLAIWWVDDCFVQSTLDGGGLPITKIPSFLEAMKSGSKADKSVEICDMLLRTSKDNDLDCHVCSFEVTV